MSNGSKSVEDMSPEEITELQKKNCIFCKIANKEIPAKIVHEDSDIICILDINPASEGHVLVYPKKHYMIVPHLPDDLLGKLFYNVKMVSNKLLTSLQCAGTTVFVANGSAAGQKAPHVLVHVFPRRENDGLVKLPKYEMNDEQIEKLKKELKPYFNHVYGKSESKETDKIEHTKTETNKTAEIEKNNEEDLELLKPRKSSNKISEHKPKPEVKKEDTKKTNSSKTNISLDDIGKLFE